MHSVTPKPTPTYLATFKRDHCEQHTGQYLWNLSPHEQSLLTGDLARQFGAPRRVALGGTNKPDPNEGICAYCERACDKAGGGPTANQIDHFYPRSGWNNLLFEWTNLMYVCRRCNDTKDDGKFIEMLTAHPDPYVNPRHPNAEAYFSFQIAGADCRMIPNDNLQDQNDEEKARRTIRDLALDDVHTIRNRNLRLLRANYVNQIKYILSNIPLNKRDALLRRLSARNCEFSSTVIWARNCGYFDL